MTSAITHFSSELLCDISQFVTVGSIGEVCSNSDLSILLHGVISLPDATSCDNQIYPTEFQLNKTNSFVSEAHFLEFVFLFHSLHPSQQLLSYVGTGLPGLNQY